MTVFKLLDKVEAPEDLRTFTEEELIELTHELRQYLLELVNETGGHLGASLGTVELTVALHHVFNTPSDKLVWDVGHQTYPHKILTKRRHLMNSLRKKDGLAPFPRREESEYDTFGVGHSSTSISAAIGMSIAHRLKKEDNKVIAVIGDGAMTAGMAFEALNHGGDANADVLVILNDNDMSISGNVGALSNYLAQILSSKLYTSMKEGSKKILSRVPPVWEFARRTETHLKGMVVPGSLFESMGFNYIGPIDGHDIPTLVKTLKKIKELKGPQFLHVITQKGKGYAPAEADPIKYHGVTKGFYDADKKKGTPSEAAITTPPKKSIPTYSQVFGNWICEMASIEPRLIGITPAMREGSGLVEFSKRFPERYIDVGIAEQHSVTLAAGLACEGLRPVVAIYSTFLQRAYDQLIHDVAIQNLPVLFALDRAGLVNDGPTHSGSFDLSFLRTVPNLVIMAPSDENECKNMLYTGMQIDGPSAVRYPRGEAAGVAMDETMHALALGKGRIIAQGKDMVIFCFGTLLQKAKVVAEHFGATLVDMRFVKPLDEDLIKELSLTHNQIVTLEENAIKGGAGSGVNEYLATLDHHNRILNLGILDYFVEHATQEEMLTSCGLSVPQMIETITSKFKLKTCQTTQTDVKSAT